MDRSLSYLFTKSVILALFLFCVSSPAFAASLSFSEETLIIRMQNGAIQAFQVEIADTDAKRGQGLMNREHLDPDRGMLFVFQQARLVRMWMKNTYIPLDMIFFDDTLHVVSIAADTVPLSETIIESGQDAAYVLETNAGTAARLGIAPGDRAERPGSATK